MMNKDNYSIQTGTDHGSVVEVPDTLATHTPYLSPADTQPVKATAFYTMWVEGLLFHRTWEHAS